MDLNKFARAVALKNAIKFNGKANPGTIIGALIKQFPSKNPKDLAKLVNKVITDVNNLSLSAQKKEFLQIDEDIFEKKEERGMFDFLNIQQGEVVKTAFPPEPSKYAHIGHAKALLINYELAKAFNGKFILRFEDTNPELAIKQFYDIHLKDYAWLGVKPDEVIHASDYMELFYEKAEFLIKKGLAYVCDCPHDFIKKGRRSGKSCSHRSFSKSKNLKRWEEMSSMKEGSRIVRLKIDLEHKNSAMRDPTIFRIITKTHPLKGRDYVIWPNYDFENAIMDGHQGITHRFRSKEFELRNELQRYIQSSLGYSITKIYEIARFELKGVETSGRKIRERIKKGNLLGWDDPRLATLVALRKRGFTSEAIFDFVISTGLSKTEVVLTWDDLYLHNRRVLDKKADRYFFIEQPKKVKIIDCPNFDVLLKKNPNSGSKERIFNLNEEFYLSKKDIKTFKNNKLYRLMDALNFKCSNGKLIYHSESVEEYKKNGVGIVHWLPVSEASKVKIMMPTGEFIEGFAEPVSLKLKKGAIIQFERFGFCRFIGGNTFYFAHK